MRTLSFICPASGATIASNIFADPATLLATSDQEVYIACTCGRRHLFKIKDGRFADPADMPEFVLPAHLRPNRISG
jgi:hypothetical protein